jgi:predicted dehydrogenase
LASGRLDVHPLITHRFSIEQAPSAYQLITSKSKEVHVGILLTYPQEQPQSSAPHAPKTEPRSSSFQPITSRETAPPKIQLGVLGAGNYAHAVLFPVLRKVDRIERIGVVSKSGLSAEHAARRFGFRYSATDENLLLSDGQINTIAILTRHHLHARQVVAALQAQKHVFCEKPLAIQPDELSLIMQTLEELRQSYSFAPLLIVGFNRRFAPLAQQMKEFLESSHEPLAIHYRINAGFLPRDHWLHDPTQGGGRIVGEVCHFVDFLTFLVGEPPTAVTAQGIPDEGRYCEDNVFLCYTFPQGSVGNIVYLANGDRSFSKERIEVFTAGRVAILDDFRLLTCIQDGKRKTVRSLLRQDKGHWGIWQSFTQAILTNAPAPIPYEHLFGVTKATFAALEALRCGEKIRIH